MTACGGDDDNASSSGSSGNGTTGATAPKPSGSTLKIGVIATTTGPQAPSSKQAATVAKGWAKWVNEELGGINGHPVQVIVKDESDPAKAQAGAKQLLDRDKVIAILAGTDNNLPAWDADAISAGVPVVSGSANSTDWYQKAGLFPTATDILSGVGGQAVVAHQFGKATKLADLYCAEVAACQQADPILKGQADKLGMDFTSLAVKATAASYTAECLQLKQQHVDYPQLNFSTDAAAKFVSDCQQQGYNPTWGSSEQAAGPGFKDLSDFTMFGPAYAFPSTADHPEVQKFRDAMKNYAPNDDWAEGSGSFAWAGLELLHKAMATVGATPTSADVMNGIYALKDENLDGLLPNKVTYQQGQPFAFGSAPCFFVVGMKDGKVTAPKNLDPVCPAPA
jgi:branched-chain amino acid transport system substrate-binding protein